MPWKLNNVTLADLGLSNVTLTRESLAPDLLEASIDGADFDANPLFDYAATVTLRDPDNIIRFVGQRVFLPGAGSGTAEDQRLTCAGPWWWLEKLVYHITWPYPGGTQQTSHLILNSTTYPSVGEQIAAVLDYAIAQGAPFQRAAINLPTRPPSSEVVDQYCAAVIIDQLRWVPDAQCWFDYTTSPPTFHCEPRSSLPRVQLTIGDDVEDGRLVDLINITPRPDQVVPGVALTFETVSQDNGTSIPGTTRQVYPPGTTGREFNAIAQTIGLQGFTRVTVSTEIECETIDINSLNFWLNRYPDLGSDRIAGLALVVSSAARSGSLGLPRMLIGGEIPNWLLAENDGSLTVEEEELSAEFSFQLFDRPASDPARQLVEEARKYPITVRVISVNAPAGVSQYSKLVEFQEAETVPADLAQYIYTSLSTLEYEGACQFIEEECTGVIGPGNRIGFLGSRAEYEELEARVQRVTENIDTGSTQVQFGPAAALSVGALIELLRANRVRRRWTANSVLESGSFGAQNEVQLGRHLARENSMSGGSALKTFGVTNGDKARAQILAVNDESSSEALPVIRATDGQPTPKGWNLRVADCVYNGVSYTLTVQATGVCVQQTDGSKREGIVLLLRSAVIYP